MNKFRALVLLALAALLIGLFLILGKSSIGWLIPSASAQSISFAPPIKGVDQTYTEVATYVVKVGGKHDLCWGNSNSNADGTERKDLQIAWRRYRVEGGPVETSQVLQYAQWPATSTPRNYCATVDGPKKAGHWAYEVRMCFSPITRGEEQDCSVWVTGITPPTATTGGGTVDGRPKGWWVYAYLPAPTGTGVN